MTLVAAAQDPYASLVISVLVVFLLVWSSVVLYWYSWSFLLNVLWSLLCLWCSQQEYGSRKPWVKLAIFRSIWVASHRGIVSGEVLILSVSLGVWKPSIIVVSCYWWYGQGHSPHVLVGVVKVASLYPMFLLVDWAIWSSGLSGGISWSGECDNSNRVNVSCSLLCALVVVIPLLYKVWFLWVSTSLIEHSRLLGLQSCLLVVDCCKMFVMCPTGVV